MPVLKRMRCVFCGQMMLCTLEQAKKHGWKLWVGGACCTRPGCLECLAEDGK